MTQETTIKTSELEHLVKQLIIDNLSPKNDKEVAYTAESLPVEASFEELGASSLDLVELVMEFDDAFEISIPDEDAKNILTTQQAIDSIRTLLESENRLI